MLTAESCTWPQVKWDTTHVISRLESLKRLTARRMLEARPLKVSVSPWCFDLLLDLAADAHRLIPLREEPPGAVTLRIAIGGSVLEVSADAEVANDWMVWAE